MLRSIFLLLTLLFWQPLAAQEASSEPEPPLTAAQKEKEALNGILARREALRAQISEKRATTQDKSLTDIERSEAAREIADLQLQIDELENEFLSLATGGKLDGIDQKSDEIINFSEELKEVLRPVIQEFRDITAAPRETEELRGEIESIKEKLKQLADARATLEEKIQSSNPAELNGALRKELEELEEKAQNLNTKLGIAEAKLAERLSNAPTFFNSLSQMVQDFFRTRGAHLLIAIAASVLVVFLLRLGYRTILRLSPKAVSRAENFTGRFLHLGYVLASIAGGLLAFVITLYLANDWLLLALTLLFLLGIAWAGKNTLPNYVEQAKMILNLGTVRHKERLIYEGVPWEVQKINFYTTLKNPALEGGLVRLPMRDLMPLQSRPNGPRELWFPTREDDWVILSDGTFGKVIQQTPDYVHLVKLGGSRKVMPTQDFLSLHPENISRNFRLSLTFGIDYRHQKIAVDRVPTILKASLQQAILERVEKDQLLSLQVFFTSAGASSLDYRIVADFSGELAPRYNTLRDFIQAICVETCNTHDWNIPFTQITVHQAENGADESAAEAESGPRLP